MKKSKVVIIILISLLMICGCSKENNKKNADKSLTCTYTQSDVNKTYESKSVVDIYTKDNYVTKVVSKETIKASDVAALESLESSYKTAYDSMNEKFKGFTYEFKKEKNTMIFKLTIDYAKMDVASYVAESDGLTKYFEDGKIKTDGIKALYESLGATCK